LMFHEKASIFRHFRVCPKNIKTSHHTSMDNFNAMRGLSDSEVL